MSQSTNEPHLTGLTDQEVIASREKNGINLLTPPQTSFHLEAISGKISRPCNSRTAGSCGILPDYFNHRKRIC